MADDKKKLYAATLSAPNVKKQNTAAAAGNLYGGSYDSQINDLYNQFANRPAFSYDVDGDALYQQYKDRYVQNAKLAMKDTMGQAAGLTGGYGSSYGQAVGQQAYDRQLQGLTDMIPTLEQSAYQKYQDAGDALKDRYSMLNAMGAAEQATNQAAYNQLAQLISTTGYTPTAADLDRAGMDSAQANALRQMWITSNPGAAYMAGQLSADDYFKLTGQYAPDVAAAMAAAAGGGGGRNSGPAAPKTPSNVDLLTEDVQTLLNNGESASSVRTYLTQTYEGYGVTEDEMKAIRDSFPVLKPDPNAGKGNGGR